MGYKTIENPGRYECVKKRSKFICCSFPIFSESQAKNHLQNIKLKHWSARHCVYAYKLLNENIEKYSDDGEPSGTAGLPLMAIIKNMNVDNILVAVVRYFGGILLGANGLRKAYAEAAKGGITAGKIIDVKLCVKGKVNTDYKLYSRAARIAEDLGAKIFNVIYSGIVSFEFYIDKSKTEIFVQKLNDILKSPEDIVFLEETYQNI